ncbi:MAG: tRNA (guanosine(37)-N1)-methyltransferase TrmD [Campylobacteraceae bacterium 4484_166]|nr:MAG: tRNA (guanosine(37)-N1)-methyltransferase TrmD [Campylobacteraceae bacterium 4484_166]
MRYIFVSIFPNLIKPYFDDSILNIAIKKGIFSIEFFNPRDYATNKHNKVDDKLCSGGAGQLMTVQPLFDCIDDIVSKYPKSHIIFPTACGKPFNQNDAKRLSHKQTIVFVCGRYEGIDERVIERYASEVFSIGNYILTGGELSSLVLCDSISRNIKGVLGNQNSLDDESFNRDNLLEAPAFAKPISYKNQNIIDDYISGDHQKIEKLKYKLSQYKTKYYTPL